MSRLRVANTLAVAFAFAAGVAMVGVPAMAKAPPAPYWKIDGNAGTNPATNFLGTTDNVALNFRVNNERAFRLEPGSFPNVIGGVAANSVSSGVLGATIGGGGAASCLGDGSSGSFSNSVTGNAGTVAGGLDNVAVASAFVGGGCHNNASGDTSTIGGGRHNVASTGWSTVGGGNANMATGDNGTVAGGVNNVASGDKATVAGGTGNTASGRLSTVGGGGECSNTSCLPGDGNTASGDHSTVGGGGGEGAPNVASGDKSTVGGGNDNTASALNATVGGGASNTAEANYATVPGGDQDTAGGASSFAAGHRAKATNDGSFVWADRADFDFSSSSFPCVRQVSSACDPTPTSGTNTFNVRATGGVRFVTAIDGSGNPTSGCYVDSFGNDTCTGSQGSLSDRRAKEGFISVNDQHVLERVADLPITFWSYKAEGPSVRHIGPTAQDFHRAFGLGPDQRYITSIDAEGVALAAIQGLNQRLSQQQDRIEALTEQLSVRGAPASSSHSLVWILTSVLSSVGLLLGAGFGWWFARRRAAAA